MPNEEWSGVLFYTVDGNFDTGITVTCKDVCLMDIGNATFTEFDISPDIASYMVDHDLLDCQMGLIHSHDQMATFFSATDIETLRKEGIDRNNFVSLIVNNAGTYTAAITRHIKASVKKTTEITYNFFADGAKNSTGNDDYIDEYIEYFMFDIVKESSLSELDTRIDKIRNDKKVSKRKPWMNNRSEIIDYDDYDDYGYDNHYYHNDRDYKKLPDNKKEKEKPKQQVINWNNSNFDKLIFNKILCQLITGSVMVDCASVNVDKWLTNFENAYTKKMPSLEMYKSWVSYYVEFLLTQIYDGNEPIDDWEAGNYAEAIRNYIVNKIPVPGTRLQLLLDEIEMFIP